MGCCSEKMIAAKNKYNQLALSEEETIITMREKSIPFSMIKLTDLDLTMKQHNYTSLLSINNLRQVLSDLSIDLEIFTSPEDPIHILLKIMQNPQRLYDYKTVILFGVVLGIGTPKEKALILYKLYDKTDSGRISEASLIEMLNDIINVSVTQIPKIAIDNSETPENFTISEKKLNEYLRNLLAKKKIFTSRALNLLVGGKSYISQGDFMKILSESSYLESLLWSFQLRLAMLDL
jgi:hypothetical protein